jgi:hypothetical protein
MESKNLSIWGKVELQDIEVLHIIRCIQQEACEIEISHSVSTFPKSQAITLIKFLCLIDLHVLKDNKETLFLYSSPDFITFAVFLKAQQPL